MSAPDSSTSSVEHTPGPWVARPDARDNGEWEVVKHDPQKPNAEDPWFICACFDGADGHEAADNARMIAAAPELLAVAQMVVEASELAGFSGPLGDAARAAILKSQGAA